MAPFYNGSDDPVWIKPEEGESRSLASGEWSDIDGYKPPNWNGDWNKVSDFSLCIADKNGDPIVFGGLPWSPWKSENPWIYEHFPGRKDPCFSTWGCGP